MDSLISNIKKTTEKILMFLKEYFWVSFNVSFLERVQVSILDFCRKNYFIFIDNKNIKSVSLYKDGL